MKCGSEGADKNKNIDWLSKIFYNGIHFETACSEIINQNFATQCSIFGKPYFKNITVKSIEHC